ncbi:hypothetical protein B7O87_07900 [Cylindrospermopsis raciborskii CENA303]|uniref:Metal-sensitive transcriptional regulator n=1 Tax=Cylindrospermopsis raciborskii CENA303 TaxID=1170769 RepID=A0A1X4G709_9CYAN|nr:metal-sensitive transcriptional regulator [Cylindrospermopsis raciborskii]EFA72602.1 Protein of unknown function DUF156 [Raphidiopsis brookii D9]OSO90734.1 hypothetical protein B7O87_07900 [Cylindrospermopsis raciborskii CENA303]
MNPSNTLADDFSQDVHTHHHNHDHQQHPDHNSGLVGAVHPHVHTEESLRRIVNRISRIEGHIRGIKTMVQQNSPCPEVLLQIAAVRGALDKVARIVLDEHLTECISRAAQNGNIDAEMEQLKAALDRFFH